MKNILIFVGVLLLASTAFAKGPVTYTFTFNGYCDGMSLQLGTGAQLSNVTFGKKVVAGVHVMTGCGYANNFVDTGWKISWSVTAPPFASPVLETADAEGLYSPSVTYEVAPTPSCVWANYYSFDGTHNNNYLSGTCTLGATPRGTGSKSSAPRQ